MSEQSNELARHQVENDLSSFLKRVRQREEQHHKLCDYTNRLLTRQAELQQTIYIHDEITRLQTFQQQSLAVDLVHQQTDFALARRCETLLTADQQNVLGRRVISRVLQVTYAAIDAFRQFGQYYSSGYIRFKQKCLKAVNQGTSKTSVAVRITSRYLTQKMQVQFQRLKQAITCLETNNYDLFQHLKTTYYDIASKKQALCKIQTSTLTITRKIISKHQKQLLDNPEKQKTKKQIRVRSKAKTTREDHQKAKRIRLKKLKKLVAQILQVMDVQKQDLLDDLAPENKDWVTKRMLNCLVERNKNNQTHIASFLEKQTQYFETIARPPPKYHQKIKRCQSLEQQLEQSSEFGKEDLNKNTLTVKDIRISETSLLKKDHLKPRSERRESMRPVPASGNKKSERKQRFTINNIEDVDLKKKEIFSSQKHLAQQESVIQIQFKGQIRLPKARFPQIAARASSVSKPKLNKQQQSPLRTKLEIKPSSIYFQQIQKRIIKFCQMKRNLVI